MLVWFWGRLGRGTGAFGVKDHVYRWLRISHREHKVLCGQCPLGLQHLVGKTGVESTKGSGVYTPYEDEVARFKRKVIVIKSDQQEAKRCYENSLKTKMGCSWLWSAHLSKTTAQESPARKALGRGDPSHLGIWWRRRLAAKRSNLASHWTKRSKTESLGDSAAPRCFRMVRLGHARYRPGFPMPPPHHGHQGQTRPLE